MKSKKPLQPTSKDKAKQYEIEKQIQIERIELGHPLGRERFEQVIKHAKKKSAN
jgi:hypothetical protein